MTRLLRCCVLVVSLTLGNHALADGRPSPSDRLAAIEKEVADADAALNNARGNVPDAQFEKISSSFEDLRDTDWDKALKIARTDPKSDTGFEAMEWLLMSAPAVYAFPFNDGEPAMDLVAKFQAANPKVGKCVARVAHYWPTWPSFFYCSAEDLFNDVIARNPNRTARGQAMLGLAIQAKRKFLAAQTSPQANQLALDAEKAFESVIRDYGDCPNLFSRTVTRPTSTLADEVESELFDLHNLRIGKPAPDIAGETLDGVKINLSDYHGKVVLLVFWASWCGPCMADVPHERELVERFKNRPFVLIGVNGDPTREGGAKAAATNQIPWQSFWNGKDGPDGPISTAWNVKGWPTVYLIDDQGIIHQRDLHGNSLDGPLEKLVANAEATKASIH